MDAEGRSSIHLFKRLQSFTLCFLVLVRKERPLVQNSEGVSHAPKCPELDQWPEHVSIEASTHCYTNISKPVSIVVRVDSVKELVKAWNLVKRVGSVVPRGDCK